MATKKIEALFQPIKIGKLELKNRIKVPAMAVAMGDKEGGISEQIKAFYGARARGGAGYIGISCTVTKLIEDPMQSIYHDRFIPDLKELADHIHANGAKCFAQAGVGYAFAFDDGPLEYVSPSGIKLTRGKKLYGYRMGGPWVQVPPRILTTEEVWKIIEAYGDGALRVKKAGYDGFEMIASVGYITAQFMNPITNTRTDEFGGSFENRMRLPVEIVKNVKKKCGSDFPMTARINGADFLEPSGYGLEDSMKMARVLEENGVEQIDVMCGWHFAPKEMVQTLVPQGSWIYLGAGIQSAVKIPVAAGTQIQDIEVAESAVASGKVQMVYMARAHVADPEICNKAKEGRLKEIRPCMNCCRCMEKSDDPPVYCTVNARVGREKDFPYEKPAEIKKRVLVVGGGPSGMEAARIASDRGHSVTIIEQNTRLGGALLIASVTNPRLGNVLKWFTREIASRPIDVKLNKTVTPQIIKEINPDAVVLAVGGAPPPLNVPGANKDILLGRGDINAMMGGHGLKKGGLIYRIKSYFGAKFIKYYYNPDTLRKLMKGNFPFKKNVLVIGGNYPGCELAECLGYLGKKVTIIEESERMGNDIGIMHRWVFMRHLKETGVRQLTNTKLLEITDNGAKVSIDGKDEFIQADTIVKVGIQKNESIAQPFKGKTPPVFYFSGDCTDPALLIEAVASGFLVGQQI
jgi:2,4-dienoyl-CoA reductase (NADPH2)